MGIHDCGDLFAGLVSFERNRQLLLAVFMASDAGCFLPGYYLQPEEKQRMARTYIDRIVGYVWVVFGLCGLLISCVSMIYWSLPILFVILLMMGMGTTLTGLIINMKLVTVSGVLGIFASLGCLYIDKFDQILLFALAFVFMMVIPGHYLNIMSKRRV